MGSEMKFSNYFPNLQCKTLRSNTNLQLNSFLFVTSFQGILKAFKTILTRFLEFFINKHKQGRITRQALQGILEC